MEVSTLITTKQTADLDINPKKRKISDNNTTSCKYEDHTEILYSKSADSDTPTSPNPQSDTLDNGTIVKSDSNTTITADTSAQFSQSARSLPLLMLSQQQAFSSIHRLQQENNRLLQELEILRHRDSSVSLNTDSQNNHRLLNEHSQSYIISESRFSAPIETQSHTRLVPQAEQSLPPAYYNYSELVRPLPHQTQHSSSSAQGN
jgi:hypothetical protein